MEGVFEEIDCSLCNGTGKMLKGDIGETLSTGMTCLDEQGHSQASYAIISDAAGVRLALSLKKGVLPYLPTFFQEMEETTKKILSKR